MLIIREKEQKKDEYRGKKINEKCSESRKKIAGESILFLFWSNLSVFLFTRGNEVCLVPTQFKETEGVYLFVICFLGYWN